MSVLEKLNAAVEQGKKDGTISEKKHGATIEAARKVAAVMDLPGWPLIDNRFDNVSPGTFLKYCTALHLIPEDLPKAEKKEAPEQPATASAIASSRWKRAANG